MANYMPVLVWTFSAVLCAYIAKKRGVRAHCFALRFCGAIWAVRNPICIDGKTGKIYSF